MSFGGDDYIYDDYSAPAPEYYSPPPASYVDNNPGIDYSALYALGGPSQGVYGTPAGDSGGYIAGDSNAFGGAPSGADPAGASVGGPSSGFESVGNWLQEAYKSFLGPGSFLGGTQGAFPNQERAGWLGPLMSVASGVYGVRQAQQQKKLAQQAIQASSPWFSSGGGANAGTRLTAVINGDMSQDPGFDLAQQAAARTSSQQPGGFAASAAAMAALKYQNDRIAALSGPAGVGFSPGAGYQTAVSGTQGANKLLSSSLGSISYGLTGQNAGMPPWLTQYLIQNGLQRPA